MSGKYSQKEIDAATSLLDLVKNKRKLKVLTKEGKVVNSVSKARVDEKIRKMGFKPIGHEPIQQTLKRKRPDKE